MIDQTPSTHAEGRQDRRPVVTALRRANQVRSAYSWFHTAWTWLFGATAATVTAATSGMLVYDVTVPPRIITASSFEPEEATNQRLGENSRLFSLAGVDDRGRRATFQLIVLDKAYTWVRGSSEQLARDGQALPITAMVETVLGGAVRNQLAASRGVIAVGVASQEGDETVETARAAARAEQTARWLTGLLGADKPLWTLNLGQFRSSASTFDADQTSWQRPFIVIAVNSAERGIELSEALADAMRGKTNLPSPQSYSRFDLHVVER